MPVTLTDIALLDPTDAQVLAFLKLSAGDAAVTLVNQASAYCERYCNRPLKARDFTAVRFPGQVGPNLRPAATPIDATATITISLDGIALTVWKAEADGDPRDFDVVLSGDVPGESTYFYRACGWMGCAPMPILATFTAGLDPIPDDLQQACLLVCQTLQRHGKGASEVQAYGPGPVSQSVSFRPDSLIPMWSRQVLDQFRVVPL